MSKIFKKLVLLALSTSLIILSASISNVYAVDELNSSEGNLAYLKPVTYSGVEGDKLANGNWKYPQFVGESAVDNNKQTRWSAAKQDNQWLQVDLNEIVEISEIFIYFHATSPDYDVYISEDGVNYTNVYEMRSGSQGKADNIQISFQSQPARYIKYVQNKMWKHTNNQYYGSSIIDLEVYKDLSIHEINLMDHNIVLSVNDEYSLNPTILPEVAKNQPLLFSSSDSSIASVDQTGTIKALNSGSSTIRVSSMNNTSVFDEVNLTVVDGDIHVSKIYFEQESISIDRGMRRFLDYKVFPNNAINKDLDVTWSSSNPEVASVDENGLLHSNDIGTTVIRVTSSENNNLYGELEVHVADLDYNPEYSLMKDRWIYRLIGSEDLDLQDADIRQYVEQINNDAVMLWNSLNKDANRTYLWKKLPNDTTSADYTTQFQNIKTLTLAFRLDGSSLQGNKELYNDIRDAMEFMVVNKKYNGSFSTGNWWDWQIGSAQPFVDSLMLLADYMDTDQLLRYNSCIEGYAKDPAIQWPSYVATGANRTDIGLVVLGTAILAKNDARMELVKDKIPDVMKLVTRGDGIYADGSLIQHTRHPYTGSYGNELLKGVGRIQSIISGTKWEIVDERIENVYNVIEDGYIPLMHKGQMMSMVNGRSISRAPGTNPFTTEFYGGSETISNIMLIAQFAPAEQKEYMLSSVKYWLTESSSKFNFYENARDMEALLSAKSIMEDSSIPSEKPFEGAKVYASMDRAVQVNNNYTVALSMYSNRIANFEFGNTENKHGWHTGDGALYLYNDDLTQYGEGYWPTVDPNRLSGTTVDTRVLADGATQGKTSPQSWVGGSTDGKNAAIGMYLDKSNLGVGMDLKAKKSWFLLDDKLIALGSDIQGTTDASIETIVENRMLNEDGSNLVIVNGDSNIQKSSQQTLDSNSWVYLEGNTTSSNIGYYFPEGGTVSYKKEQRLGKYEDINGYFVNDIEYSKNYFEIALQHGNQVIDSTYQYIILPGYSKDEVENFSETSDLEILEVNKDVHAIKDTNTFAMNVFSNDGYSINGFHVNKASSLYSTKIGDTLEINISNPNQNDVDIVLSLDEFYFEVISISDSIEIKDTSFVIHTAGSAGSSHKILLRVAADKTELASTIELVTNLDENEYTVDSWSELSKTLKQANIILNKKDATQEEVDMMNEELSSSINSLVIKANKDSLKEMLQSLLLLNENDYTKESWLKLNLLVEDAKLIMENDNATQLEVDTMLDAIVTAILSLELVNELQVNTDELDRLIIEAQSLVEAMYTPESWSILRSDLEDSIMFRLQISSNTMQDEVDAYASKLLQSIDQLVEVSESTKPMNPINPKSPTTGINLFNSSWIWILALSALFLTINTKRYKKSR